MANDKLASAKNAKKDEFYTQYDDIQKEINMYLEYNADTFKDKIVLLPCDDPEWSNFTKFFAQNFELLGLKKLISTSYASDSKFRKYGKQEYFHQITLFECESERFDENKTNSHGKIFTLTHDNNNSGRIDIDDLEWDYLDGDGDFASEEVTRLRDEADIIVTNPPFSLFPEFLKWVLDGNKQFLIIGNQNSITYKDVFYLIKENKVWLGPSIHSGDREFRVPDSYPLNASGCRIDEHGNKFIRVKGVRWFTNLEHGRRHQPLRLMTMHDNIRYSKHKDVIGKEYAKYETYDAIDIPYYDCIPKDYNGVMGVPKSFMDFYCSEQFEILGYERDDDVIQVGIETLPEEFLKTYREQGGRGHYTKGMKMLCLYNSDGEAKIPFSRILIRYTDEWIKSHPEDFTNDSSGNKEA